MQAAFKKDELQRAVIDFYILATGVPVAFQDHAGNIAAYRYSLIERWRRTLLRDIEYCLACELRHALDGTGKFRPDSTKPSAWFKAQFGEPGLLWYQTWTSYLDGKNISNTPTFADSATQEDFDAVFAANVNAKNPSKRHRSYIGAKVAEETNGLSLIEVAFRVFNPAFVRWPSAYGGAKWRQVARVLFDLWLSSNVSNVVQLIDVAFALQHNTGVVFNKNSIWSSKGSYTWIQKMLDMRWAAQSCFSLLGMASPQLQKMVSEHPFVLPSALSPEETSKTIPSVGSKVSIVCGGKTLSTKIERVETSIFETVVLSAEEFKVVKKIGDALREVNLRAFSGEEFRRALKQALPVQASTSPLPASSEEEEESEQEVFTEAVQTAYLAASVALMDYTKSKEGADKPYSIGTLIAGEGGWRFRLKGHPVPLRLYFMQFKSGELSFFFTKTEEKSVPCPEDTP